jgi:hypothetical protein
MFSGHLAWFAGFSIKSHKILFDKKYPSNYVIWTFPLSSNLIHCILCDNTINLSSKYLGDCAACYFCDCDACYFCDCAACYLKSV